MMKCGLDFFYFEILLAPSEIPANLPGQFSFSGQIFLHWAAATLNGLVEFQNKKNLDHFYYRQFALLMEFFQFCELKLPKSDFQNQYSMPRVFLKKKILKNNSLGELFLLKFSFFEKATKICVIFLRLWF